MMIQSLMPGFTCEAKLSAGQAVPFKMDVQGDVFQSSSSGENKIDVIQDIFVKTIEGNNILFSLDGENWSEFTELFTGNVGVSFGIQDENPMITGCVLANLRS